MRDYQRGERDGRGWQRGQTGQERQRHREGISGAVLGLRLVSVADVYLWVPVHCGIFQWTGSAQDFSPQSAVGLGHLGRSGSKAPPGVLLRGSLVGTSSEKSGRDTYRRPVPLLPSSEFVCFFSKNCIESKYKSRLYFNTRCCSH